MKSLVVCLLSLLVSASTALAEEPTVSGQVRLVDGSAVAGAQVMLFDVSDLRRGALGQATTDADGQFALTALGGHALPQGFALGQNYPNPFNPGTVIPYQLATAGYVRLEVFNVLGQQVVTLVDGEQAAGAYTVSWDARDASGYGVAAGVYIYRLTAGGAAATRRMVLVDGPAGSGRTGVTGPVLEATEDAPVYGLTVSGRGVETYVDAAFAVEAWSVEVVVEATVEAGRRKVLVEGVLGDVNNDGFVNSVDALLVATYSTNPAMTVPNNGSIQRGDMNGDGQITLSDALIILGASVPGPARKVASDTQYLQVKGTKRAKIGREPTWRPDGEAIAYVDDINVELNNGGEVKADAIWVYYPRGVAFGNDGLLSGRESRNKVNPAWSPDGETIAYATAPALGFRGVWNIHLMSAHPDATGTPTRWNLFSYIVSAFSDETDPAWSPDGSLLAFVSTRDVIGRDIYLAGKKYGNKLHNLTNSWHHDRDPAWSPDGSQMAFVSDRDDNWEIYVMDIDGENLKRLTNHNADDTEPAWSPDGQYITFSSTRDGNSEIYVMPASGGSPQNLTNNAAADSSSAWSPDGTQIAFSRLTDPEDEDNPHSIFLMEVGDASDSGDGGVVVQEQTFSLGRGGEMAMVWIEAGKFEMGSPESERSNCDWCDNEGPLHEVEISTGFWLGKHEVTVGQFRRFVAETGYDAGDGCWAYENDEWEHHSDRNWRNPGYAQADDHPVVCVSWEGMDAYAKWLSVETGVVYRLPSEAEWEYACRAGTQTRWSFGDDEDQLEDYAWYSGNNSPWGTKAVGGKSPNAWRLHDMHGNVYEWVQDWYDEDYYKSLPRENPQGPEDGEYRVVRGGDFRAHGVRSAFRWGSRPTGRINFVGARLVRTTSPVSVEEPDSPGDGGGLPSGALASYQGFHVIAHDLDETQSHDGACKAQLGSSVRLADWTDVVAYYDGGGSLSAFIAGLKLGVYGAALTGDQLAGGYRLSANGNSIWPEQQAHGLDRHYFLARHDHRRPDYFLAHADLDNHHLSLGSWYGQGGYALCYGDVSGGGGSSGQESMEFVWIEPGVFQMGSDYGYSDEMPLHEVEISKGFWLGKYEVTQGQWEAVMGTTPWSGKSYVQSNSSHPAVYISWYDVHEFIGLLNDAAGDSLYRLPSEAEWEYACRAGTQTRWSFGDDASQLTHYAWYGIDEEESYAVGLKRPNAWGLYDMHGNASEWVQDWYRRDYYNSSPRVDPPGPSSSNNRVIRGGNVYHDGAADVRSAARDYYRPGSRNHFDIGVRLLRIR